MSLTYSKDLAAAFNNIYQIHDYKSFLTEDKCLEKVLRENLPFDFGSHNTNININDDLTYIVKNNNDYPTFCGKCYEKYKQFVNDCECLKVDKVKTKLFIPRLFDLYFGFYSDVTIEFDIFVNDNFIRHYILEKRKLTPLYNKNNKNNENIAWVSLNTPCYDNCLEIRNIKTNTNQFNLILLGVNLNFDLRNETISSKKHEIIL